MSTLKSKTHHVVLITYIDASGEHDGGEGRVHKSRTCGNCAHDGLRDADWAADGGVEKFGRCLNLCSAGDATDEVNRWCDEHQSGREFEAGLHRPHRPVFSVVIKGGAAA